MNDEVAHAPSAEHAKAEAERYIKGVVNRSIGWYQRHGLRNNVLYNSTRMGVIVFSFSLPAIAAVAKNSSSPWPDAALMVIPVIIGILAALDGFFHWGELWKSRTSAEIALRRIKREFRADWQTLSLVPENERVEKAYAKYTGLVTQVETVMATEEETFWGRRIKQLKPPPK